MKILYFRISENTGMSKYTDDNEFNNIKINSKNCLDC